MSDVVCPKCGYAWKSATWDQLQKARTEAGRALGLYRVLKGRKRLTAIATVHEILKDIAGEGT